MSTSPNSSSSSDVAPAASAPGTPLAAMTGTPLASISGTPVASMAWLMDVTCRVDVVLGTCAVKVRDCLALSRGSVVPLVQAAGTDLELRAEGVALAQGEVVMLEDRTSLRISRILPPSGTEAA